MCVFQSSQRFCNGRKEEEQEGSRSTTNIAKPYQELCQILDVNVANVGMEWTMTLTIIEHITTSLSHI